MLYLAIDPIDTINNRRDIGGDVAKLVAGGCKGSNGLPRLLDPAIAPSYFGGTDYAVIFKSPIWSTSMLASRIRHRNRYLVAIPGLLAAAISFLTVPVQSVAGPLYVLDKTSYDSYDIDTYTSDGVRSTFASEVGQAEALTCDASGNVFLVERLGQIDKFTPQGVESSFGYSPNCQTLACDANGDVFAPGNNGVLEFSPSGVKSVLAAPNLLGVAVGTTFDRSGNLYVAVYGGSPGLDRIFEFAPNGTYSAYSNILRIPYGGIAFDSIGNLYVSVSVGVEEIHLDGSYSFIQASDAAQTNSVAFDASGTLYAASVGGPDGDGYIFDFPAAGGSSTFASFGLDDPESIAFAPVPEPSTWLLATFGVGGLWFVRRRSR